MLILGFACKVKGYRASNNGLAVSWKHLAAIGVDVPPCAKSDLLFPSASKPLQTTSGCLIMAVSLMV